MEPDANNSKNTTARQVCLALAGVALLSAIALASFAISLGPPEGDLTRIGGLSERRFGWQRTGAQYAQDHFRKLPLDQLLAEGPDGSIVVFGDSFTDSAKSGTSWLNALYEQTGARIDFVEYSTLTDVVELMSSPSFQANPANVIILQMGERTIFRRAQPLIGAGDCALPPPPKPFEAKAAEVELLPWTLRTRFDSFDELMSWGALALRRRVFDTGKTVVVDLDRDDLFTSSRPDKLLIYQSDIIRHTPEALFPFSPDEAGQGVICALRQVINLGAGRTEVYVLVAPDKRSVFEPWTTSELPPKAIRFLDLLPGTLNGRYIDSFQAIRQDIDSGVKDVYFPNDTHWNDETARNIGRIVSKFISNPASF